MTTSGFSNQSAVVQAVTLMSHYGFDTKGLTVAELVLQWLEVYEASWIRSAVIEALYQGRYKGVSVEQILRLWLRREQPAPHYNTDFERIICRKFPDCFGGAVEPLPDYLQYLDDEDPQEEATLNREQTPEPQTPPLANLSQLLEWEGEELELDSTPMTLLPIVLNLGDRAASQNENPAASEPTPPPPEETLPQKPLASDTSPETPPQDPTEPKEKKGKPESPVLPQMNPLSSQYFPSAIRKFTPHLDKKASGFYRKLDQMKQAPPETPLDMGLELVLWEFLPEVQSQESNNNQ